MKRGCVYCGGAGASREHVVSRSVLRVAFGDDIKNILHSDLFGGQLLKHYEHTIKDVCQQCNSSMSVYDEAGVALARFIHERDRGVDLKIPLSEKTLGWLVKTHLNYLRAASRPGDLDGYDTGRLIYERLITHQPISPDICRILALIWDAPPLAWDHTRERALPYYEIRPYLPRTWTVQRVGIDITRHTHVVISHFRLKWFATYLILPANGSYAEWDIRCERTTRFLRERFGVIPQAIETSHIAANGFIRVRATLPSQRIADFLKRSRTIEIP